MPRHHRALRGAVARQLWRAVNAGGIPAVTAAVWAILLWAGFTFDGGWIWTISITAGVVAAVLAALLVPKRRVVADERLFLNLTGGKA